MYDDHHDWGNPCEGFEDEIVSSRADRLEQDAQENFAKAKRQLVEAVLQADELRALERRKPNEPRTDEGRQPVVYFTKQFFKARKSPTEYTFATVRAAGKWYVTGAYQAGQRLSWHELLDFIEPENWHTMRVLQGMYEVKEGTYDD